ncbi:uncharacterized protein J3D65DRAFT_52084 [Phyllosticta citribraziliensis]|uniref:Uncharacterized protein n=1 Tax=Phyllosticta citribraziliensis TaxID=989973 RepID=A0ABR1LC21_9PEZI
MAPWPNSTKAEKLSHLELINAKAGDQDIAQIIHRAIAPRNKRGTPMEIWDLSVECLGAIRKLMILDGDVQRHRAALLARVRAPGRATYHRSGAQFLTKKDLDDQVGALCAAEGWTMKQLVAKSRSEGQCRSKQRCKRKADEPVDEPLPKHARTAALEPAHEEEEDNFFADILKVCVRFPGTMILSKVPARAPRTAPPHPAFLALFTGEGGWRSCPNLDFEPAHRAP